MQIRYAFSFAFVWLMLLVGCQETVSSHKTDQDSIQISPYEAFSKKFIMADSVPASFDNDNSLAWYNDENHIEDTLFHALLKDKTFKGFKNEEGTFTISEKNKSFQYSGQIPLSTKFHSFLVSARTDLATHKWKIYLVNFSLEGDFRDALLISYRDSYMSTRENYTVRTGAYRTTQFMDGQRLEIMDVVYDNRVDNPAITDPEEKPLEDERSKTITAYQLRFDGTFKMLRQDEKPKEEATPE